MVCADLRCPLLPPPPALQQLSLHPRAYLMPRFLTQGQCDHVIAMATKRLAPSGECLPLCLHWFADEFACLVG